MKLHCLIAIQVEKKREQFNIFLLEWEKCLRIFNSVTIPWALPTYTVLIQRERSANTGCRTHSAVFLAVINEVFPIFCEVFRSFEPPLAAASFYNVDFMEAAAHTQPVTLQETVGLNRHPDLLLSTTFY